MDMGALWLMCTHGFGSPWAWVPLAEGTWGGFSMGMEGHGDLINLPWCFGTHLLVDMGAPWGGWSRRWVLGLHGEESPWHGCPWTWVLHNFAWTWRLHKFVRP